MTHPPTWPNGVQRVAAALQTLGHPHAPVLLDDAALTAAQAAAGLGVAVGQIAKSIIFRRLSDDAAVLVVTAGDQRVDEHKVAALVGALGRADADFVKAKTGFSIGGVAPLAHTHHSLTLIDQSLFRFAHIWAAAGHPHAVFCMTPKDLQTLTQAPVADLALATAPVAPPSTPPTSPTPRPGLPTHRAAAFALLQERLALAQQSPQSPPSPCVSWCRMDAASQRCEGCLRSLDEIATWGTLTATAQHAIWQAIAKRLPSGAA
jgi:prolyl-tRNA editing enzyme YbaK/EbsC (Cys-tRNA(Pro) deacylase)/predicted Fe-S protein YdhL (DUF1289 family)